MLICWHLLYYYVGNLNLSIDDKLEHKFRKRALELHGMKKGAYKTAMEDAIRVWLDARSETSATK